MKNNGKRKARSNGAREPHKLFDLSPKKIRALEALLTASSVTDAAKMAGADRTTLHRWLSDDSQFRAAYNWEKEQRFAALHHGAIRLGERALHVAEELLSDDDVAASAKLSAVLAILKGLGVLSGKAPPTGPTDPWEVSFRDLLLKDIAEMLRKQVTYEGLGIGLAEQQLLETLRRAVDEGSRGTGGLGISKERIDELKKLFEELDKESGRDGGAAEKT